MKWTSEAENAIKKVPFFVRKRVKERVEKEAREEGRRAVSISQVQATKKRFLTGMESEVKGYQIDTCFGQGGCPNTAHSGEHLLKEIEDLVKKEDLLDFLQKRVKGTLKFHHEFRITLADCPNACSQPQIKDIGIIGAVIPEISQEPCSLCHACVEVCDDDDAITMDTEKEIPDIDHELCLKCGKCIGVCPTGTLIEGEKGFRVLLGGKLGRHPKLATELPGIFKGKEVLNIVKNCIDFYKKNSKTGERFAHIFTVPDFLEL